MMLTFISLLVKSLSATSGRNAVVFAFKHMLECTSTDSARGYSVSFSMLETLCASQVLGALISQ